MKWIKSYHLFEGSDDNTTEKDIQTEISDCFQMLSDMMPTSFSVNHGSGIMIRRASQLKGKQWGFVKNKDVANNIKFEVMIIPSLKEFNSKDRYRHSNFTPEMINEIEHSLNVIESTDAIFISALIEYINTYDYDKGEQRPGTSIKGYNRIDVLLNKLKKETDKVRWVKIYFGIK